MKIIRVMETAIPIQTIYTQAKTKSQRALLGYIVKKGFTDDYIAIGAFHLLREVENANKSKLLYQLCMDEPNAEHIVQCCELAQQGAFRRFAISAREIRKCVRLMKL